MTAPRTPIRSANDPPPSPPDSSGELNPPPDPNPNDSTGRTEGDGDPPPNDDTEAVRQQRYIGILEDNLREQNRTLQALAERGERTPASPPPPPPDPASERTAFYNDPIAATRRVIRDELTETVKPLLDFVQGLKGQTAVDRFMTGVKNDQRFSGMWDSAVEAAVNETLAKVKPEDINEAVVRSAAVQAIGLKAMNLLPGATAPSGAPPAPPAPTGDRRVPNSPPHMRPSAPPAPSGGNGNKPKLRALTENEERLRRENNQTHEDFLFWLELPAGEVTTAIPPSKRGK